VRLKGHPAQAGEMTSSYKIVVRKPEEKRPLCSWEYNITRHSGKN
jgi:hypothetical protein